MEGDGQCLPVSFPYMDTRGEALLLAGGMRRISERTLELKDELSDGNSVPQHP